MFNNSFKRDEIPEEVLSSVQNTYLFFVMLKKAKGLNEEGKEKLSAFKSATESNVWSFTLIAEIAEFYLANLRLARQHPKKVIPGRLKECHTVIGFLEKHFEIKSSPLGTMLVVKTNKGGVL